jgi:hypothetical protein
MVVKYHIDSKAYSINLDGLCMEIGSGGRRFIWWRSEISRKGTIKGIIIWSTSCENFTTNFVGPKYDQH